MDVVGVITFLSLIIIYCSQDDLINVVRGVLEVENDGLSSLPLTSAESANIPKAVFEQTEKERWRKLNYRILQVIMSL